MKRFLRLTLTSVCFVFMLTSSHPMHASALSATSPEPATSGEVAYAAGTRAMNEQRWPDAVRAFEQVINTKGSKQVDAALYWKAYSLSRMSRQADAAATCDMLHVKYPGSNWNTDCAALSIGKHESDKNLAISPVSPMSDGSDAAASATTGADEDLKLLALNSLAHQDPTRAMPILRGVLAGNQPIEMKKHAIFALTQSRSPEAAAIIQDAVTGKMGSGVQCMAIPVVGAFEGKGYNDTFTEVYRTSSDPQVKRAVISALFISQDAPRMVALARGERDLTLKRDIVAQLALMNDKAATDYMFELLK